MTDPALTPVPVFGEVGADPPVEACLTTLAMPKSIGLVVAMGAEDPYDSAEPTGES